MSWITSTGKLSHSIIFNELSVLEIAEQLGSNENTVKARLSRGRARLRTLLEKGDEDGAGIYE